MENLNHRLKTMPIKPVSFFFTLKRYEKSKAVRSREIERDCVKWGSLKTREREREIVLNVVLLKLEREREREREIVLNGVLLKLGSIDRVVLFLPLKKEKNRTKAQLS